MCQDLKIFAKFVKYDKKMKNMSKDLKEESQNMYMGCNINGRDKTTAWINV